MRRPNRGLRLFLRDALIILVVAILVSFLVKTFLVRSFYIPSGSMKNTLQVDDRILVNQLTPNLVPLNRGDVVVFRDPGSWLGEAEIAAPAQSPLAAASNWLLSLIGLSATDGHGYLVKRVIGLPGDHVVCCNALGQMSVNDVPIDEPYIQLPGGVTRVSEFDFDVTVPADGAWVMGDNRYNSRDSRYHQGDEGGGSVPYEDIDGRALLVSWPLKHWTWLDNFTAVFQEAGTAG